MVVSAAVPVEFSRQSDHHAVVRLGVRFVLKRSIRDGSYEGARAQGDHMCGKPLKKLLNKA